MWLVDMEARPEGEVIVLHSWCPEDGRKSAHASCQGVSWCFYVEFCCSGELTCFIM